MIQYPPSLIAVGGARTGIAPVNLLDVQDVNGKIYYWADRPIVAPAAILSSAVQGGLVAPYPVPAGQQIAWSFPTQASAGFNDGDGANGSAIVTGSQSAELSMTFGRSLGTNHFWVQWSGFALPALPSGAIISAVYPCYIASASYANNGPSAGIGANAGDGINMSAWEPGGILLSFPGGQSPVASAQYGPSVQTSLGNTAAAVQNCVLGVSLGDTANDGVYSEPSTLSVTAVGLAVYYTLGSGGSGTGAPFSTNPSIPGYAPWLLSVPSFSFHRSLQTDMGSFVLQNLSGDTLSRDFERIMRRSALEGSLFVWRLWQPDAQAAWVEVHGTLSVEAIGPESVQLRGAQLLNPSQDDTPLENFCETCQLQWGGARCGSTQTTECSYSYQTCQVPERIMVVMNNYEKNYGQTLAKIPQQVVNRARKI